MVKKHVKTTKEKKGGIISKENYTSTTKTKSLFTEKSQDTKTDRTKTEEES
jgi:large subunit ribosomal protein L24